MGMGRMGAGLPVQWNVPWVTWKGRGRSGPRIHDLSAEVGLHRWDAGPRPYLGRVRQLLLPKSGSPGSGTDGAAASVGTVTTVEDCWTANAVDGNRARISPMPG